MRIRGIAAAAGSVAVASALVLSGCAAGGGGEEQGNDEIITALGSEPQNPVLQAVVPTYVCPLDDLTHEPTAGFY